LLSGAVVNEGPIKGLLLSGAVVNEGPIKGLLLSGAVVNKGPIKGLLLSGAVVNEGPIKGLLLSGAGIMGPLHYGGGVKRADNIKETSCDQKYGAPLHRVYIIESDILQ